MRMAQNAKIEVLVMVVFLRGIVERFHGHLPRIETTASRCVIQVND
jgi:hypothetical protein